MQTTRTEADVVAAACARLGLPDAGAAPLRRHATSVWHLPLADAVARLSRSEDLEAIRRAISITTWLTSLGFAALEPLEVEQPILVDDTAVSIWRYYPPGPPANPPASELGALLRALHELPPPPVALPTYVPLRGFGIALEHSDAPMSAADRNWLAERRLELLHQYASITTALGEGLIHGDAYPGNLLWDGHDFRLGDWDEVAHGPRELDLVNTHQGARFGRSLVDREAFNSAYGWDITKWPDFEVLRSIRDLHTLGSFIGRARTDSTARDELAHRIGTLRAGDVTARWNAG